MYYAPNVARALLGFGAYVGLSAGEVWLVVDVNTLAHCVVGVVKKNLANEKVKKGPIRRGPK